MSDWFTDALLIAIYVALAATLAAVVVSSVMSARRRLSDAAVVNGINTPLIVGITAAAVVACLIITYVTGSSQPIIIGGEEYADTLWLKASEMFINTAIVLLAAIIVLALALPIICRIIKK